MLVRLFAKNFGVFRDGFDLSLEATRLETEGDRGFFEVHIAAEERPLRLLRLAAIYGPNGSGKSTVVRAAKALHDIVVRSGPALQEGERLPGYSPFALDATTTNRPSTLGCEVVVEDRIFEYSVSFTAQEVTEEKITERGRSSDYTWLHRDSSGAIKVDEGRLPAALTLDLATVTRRNAAALSVAAQLKQEALLGVFRAVKASLRTIAWDVEDLGLRGYSLRRLHEDPDFRSWALQRLLKPADLGITDLRTEEREIQPELFGELSKFVDIGGFDKMPKLLDAVMTHRGVGGDYPIELGAESTGTQKMLALAGPWYDVVRKQLTVFVDELSASLHPTLLVALLEALNASSDKPRSQLVFTVHDPSPLEDVLRRDQVYFTEKDDSGVARLTPLADFKDRNVHNIRKRYLEGRYGGLPRLPDFGSLFEEADVGN